MLSRHQATLFVPSSSSSIVEAIRSRFDPIQSSLIRAHVTLCREDEVDDWDELEARLRELGAIEVELAFSHPIRSGNFVYVPVTGFTKPFDELRCSLLSTHGKPPRPHDPHITLVHPRNGTCADRDFREIAKQLEPFSAVFREVTFIEQLDGGTWRRLSSFGC